MICNGGKESQGKGKKKENGRVNSYWREKESQGEGKKKEYVWFKFILAETKSPGDGKEKMKNNKKIPGPLGVLGDIA